MRLYLAGNGEREKWLKECALLKGHELTQNAFDAAVMELPFTKLTAETERLLGNGSRVICGKCDDAFLRAAAEKKWRLYHVLEDEAYARKNAALTAEGAVFAAMRETKSALMDCRCLVIGYGRIGQSLTEKLRGLDAQTHVSARRAESRVAAGEGSMDISKIQEKIANYDMVFNTVPSPVLSGDILKNAKKDCIFFELASPPYGIDFDAAKELGLKTCLESGIPGRYCPRSAAQILLEFIERSVKFDE